MRMRRVDKIMLDITELFGGQKVPYLPQNLCGINSTGTYIFLDVPTHLSNQIEEEEGCCILVPGHIRVSIPRVTHGLEDLGNLGVSRRVCRRSKRSYLAPESHPSVLNLIVE